MILNTKNSSFILLFPANFFDVKVKAKYSNYFKSALLPYESIDDFMSFTVQQVDFPEWDMQLATQIRHRGKVQEYKSSKPVEDLFKRKFVVTFKLTDAWLNYFIFLDNAREFLDFNNIKQVFDPITLAFLNNEGYLISSVIFNKPILSGMGGFTLSQSALTPEFKTFSATFNYFDFDIKVAID